MVYPAVFGKIMTLRDMYLMWTWLCWVNDWT